MWYDEGMNEQVRARVKQVMKQRGITQLELAQRLGMKPPHVSRMLGSGKHGGGMLPGNWGELLKELDLELTAVPRAADNG